MSANVFITEMIEKYPNVFAKKADDHQPFQLFGIECGEGWYTLLNNLFACINFHLEYVNRNKSEDKKTPFVLTQVKEKFGTLRFYYEGGDSKIHGMVQMAEAMSGFICEKCGNPGKLRRGSWLHTACEVHTRVKE